MKRVMNRNGRKKEARAIFLIMKTLLCVSFCFVVRGRYSNRALLLSTTLSPPSPSRHPFASPPSYTHPPATTTAAAAAAAHLLFLYYNVRALSGGSDGSGAEAGLPAGCRLERVPGWDCFSNELHSSGLCVSVGGAPPFTLAGSFPPRARESSFFPPFPPLSSWPSFSPRGPPYFSPRAAFDGESFLSMVTRACYVANIVRRDRRQVIIEYLSSILSLSPPSYPVCLFFYFPCALEQLATKNYLSSIVVLKWYFFNVITFNIRVTYYHGYLCAPSFEIIGHSPYFFFFLLFEFYIFPYRLFAIESFFLKDTMSKVAVTHSLDCLFSFIFLLCTFLYSSIVDLHCIL